MPDVAFARARELALCCFAVLEELVKLGEGVVVGERGVLVGRKWGEQRVSGVTVRPDQESQATNSAFYLNLGADPREHQWTFRACKRIFLWFV